MSPMAAIGTQMYTGRPRALPYCWTARSRAAQFSRGRACRDADRLQRIA